MQIMHLQVVAGLILLLIGGDLLVRGAVSLAQRLDVPTIVIGLTVVAFGTSAPELVVCVNAALSGAPTLALGNVVGSNIANVLLVIGLPAMIYPISCCAPTVTRDAYLMVLGSALFLILAWTGVLGFWQGLLLLILLVLVMSYSARRACQYPELAQEELADFDAIAQVPHSLLLSIAFIALGLGGLAYGSHNLIEGSIALARAHHVSESTIGLTVVALGTSLPELATVIAAALKKHSDVAIGNVIGSNLFNMFGIMGITAMIAPIPVPDAFRYYDLWVMLASSSLLLFFGLGGHHGIDRKIGFGFVALYAAYIASLVMGASAISPPGGAI